MVGRAYMLQTSVTLSGASVYPTRGSISALAEYHRWFVPASACKLTSAFGTRTQCVYFFKHNYPQLRYTEKAE